MVSRKKEIGVLVEAQPGIFTPDRKAAFREESEEFIIVVILPSSP